MDQVIPRWEWRAFGPSFGAADARFAALKVEKTQESDEIYLLSPATDANIKIRFELMDVKTLERVDANGLEQWRPVMKGTFPLPFAEVTKVCAALGVAPPQPHGPDAYTLDQLRTELAAPDRGVRAVDVHKRRLRYTINGCMSEMTDVTVAGKPVRSVAIESEDPDRVIATVREMGLSGYRNTSYPRGLKIVLGMKA